MCTLPTWTRLVVLILMTKNFVLAALITNERNWQIIDNSVKAIKLKHFAGLSDEDVELHAKDMQNQKGIFESLPWETIYAIHNDIFDFVEQTTVEMHIIAIVIALIKANPLRQVMTDAALLKLRLVISEPLMLIPFLLPYRVEAFRNKDTQVRNKNR